MSDAAQSGRHREVEGEATFVVDVTAPIAPARVQWVAAEAAARLRLPPEKLIALLENRIGPVTKPLPRRSAERVAEVLDRAGAEVQVRPACEDPVAQPGPPPARRGPPAPETQERMPAASNAATPPVRRDDWDERFDDDDEPADPMLGRWERSAKAVASDEAPPDDAGGAKEPAPNPAPKPAATRASRTPTVERRAAGPRRGQLTPPPVDPEPDPGPYPDPALHETVFTDDEEDDDFAYGTRDPFREAERNARRTRRTLLLGSLLLAALVLAVLQWAYSGVSHDAAAPPPFQQGLHAYRAGSFVSAARAWRPAAEAGDPQAMFMLGFMAEHGQGRPWSAREAASWYREAAERGHATAQRRLAALYREGLGVERSPQRALEWTLRAAQAGDPHAAWEAVQALVRAGRFEEADRWLPAAAQAHPDAAAWAAWRASQAP